MIPDVRGRGLQPFGLIWDNESEIITFPFTLIDINTKIKMQNIV